MEVNKTNNRNFLVLIERAGSQIAFSELLNITASQVSHIVTKRRNLGEKLARKIELRLDLPPDSMDSPIITGESDRNLGDNNTPLSKEGEAIARMYEHLPESQRRVVRALVDSLDDARNTGTNK